MQKVTFVLKVSIVLSFLAMTSTWVLTPIRVAAAENQNYDIIVYGGTSAAVTTAVQAKAMGKSVAIVSPDKHLGGLTSGGLGWTDS